MGCVYPYIDGLLVVYTVFVIGKVTLVERSTVVIKLNYENVCVLTI
jgi:hypothetical protein